MYRFIIAYVLANTEQDETSVIYIYRAYDLFLGPLETLMSLFVSTVSIVSNVPIVLLSLFHLLPLFIISPILRSFKGTTCYAV